MWVTFIRSSAGRFCPNPDYRHSPPGEPWNTKDAVGDEIFPGKDAYNRVRRAETHPKNPGNVAGRWQESFIIKKSRA